MAGGGQEVGLGLERLLQGVIGGPQIDVGRPHLVAALPNREEAQGQQHQDQRRSAQEAGGDGVALAAELQVALKLAGLEPGDLQVLVGEIEAGGHQGGVGRDRHVAGVVVQALERLQMLERQTVLPQLLIGLVGDLVEVAIGQGGGPQVDALEGLLQPSPGQVRRAAPQGDLGGHAPQERLLLRRGGVGQAQAAIDIGLGGRQPSRLHLGGGEVGEDAGLQGRAPHLAGQGDRGFESGDGLVVAAELLIGIGLVIDRRDQQHRVALVDLGGLGGILQHALVIAGVLVERADLLQRLGLAARVVGGAVDLEGALEILQRRLDVAHGRLGAALGHQQVAMELAVRLPRGDRLQGVADHRFGRLHLIGPHQRLALEPLCGRDRHGRVAGKGPGDGQGVLRGLQGRGWVDHHRRLGLGDGGLERGRRRRSGQGRSRQERQGEAHGRRCTSQLHRWSPAPRAG